MRSKMLCITAVVAALGAVPTGIEAQETFKTPAVQNEAWIKPFPPVRIVGNVYYVGTYDLAVYLITTPKGHILINTGVNDSIAPIRANVEALGFKLADVKLLLATGLLVLTGALLAAGQASAAYPYPSPTGDPRDYTQYKLAPGVVPNEIPQDANALFEDAWGTTLVEGRRIASELAALTGQTDLMIRTCLKWFNQHTEIAVTAFSEDMYQLTNNPAPSKVSSTIYPERLKTLASETNAYRRYWRTLKFD